MTCQILFCMLGKNSADDILKDNIFSYFSQKTGLTFRASCLQMETICMKCNILFSGKKLEKYCEMLTA